MKILTAAVLLLPYLATGTHCSAGWSHTIRLNDQANRGVIEDNGDPDDNIVQIRSTNNTFPTSEFAIPDGDLILDWGGGDDRISIEVSLDCNIVVNGGSGNDQTLFGPGSGQSFITGNVTSNDLQGDNSLSFLRSQVAGNVIAIDGPGSQVVSTFNSRIGGNLIVTSPDGGGVVSLGTTLVSGDVLVANAGNGNDRFFMNRASAGGDVYLEHGNGDLLMSVIQAGVRSFTSIVESGTTDVFLGELGSRSDIELICEEGSMDIRAFSPFVNGRFAVRGGLGYDEILVAGLGRSGADALPIVDISTGDGGSDITVRSQGALGARTTIPQMNVYCGDGTDQLTISFIGQSSLVGSLTFVSGRGNSALTIEDLTANSGSVVGEIAALQGVPDEIGARHSLTIDAATIDGSVNFLSESGGVDVSVRRATVFGSLNLRADQASQPTQLDNVFITESNVIGDFNFTTFGSDSIVFARNSQVGGNFIADAREPGQHVLVLGSTLVGGFVYTPGY